MAYDSSINDTKNTAAVPNPFYDLASLAKCLVTAPLSLQHLDLDIDRREQLGFVGEHLHRDEPLTARMLLSHQSGLPPWLPYNNEDTVAQLVLNFDKYGAHTLLRRGKVGTSTYSDLNYRSLGELLVLEQGKSYRELAKGKGLSHQPWTHLLPQKQVHGQAQYQDREDHQQQQEGREEQQQQQKNEAGFDYNTGTDTGTAIAEDIGESEGEGGEALGFPFFIPDGPDKETWAIASKDGLLSYPLRRVYLPHDANSRAGMLGHAGFGANKQQFTTCLTNWLQEGWPQKQAITHCIADDGYTQWGLGLLRCMDGCGKYGDILMELEGIEGVLQNDSVVVIEDSTTELASESIPLAAFSSSTSTSTAATGSCFTDNSGVGNPCNWWMHTGFTGPIVFVHPIKCIVIGLLMHRRGPHGELIDIDKRRARAYAMIKKHFGIGINR